MRRTFGIAVLGIALLALVSTSYWLNQRGINSQQHASQTRSPQLGQVGGSNYFYLVNDNPIEALLNDDDTEPRGNWLFANQNSTGVSEGLAQQFPELIPDFALIGNENAARERFLIDKGHTFRYPTHYYKTEIHQRGKVNGEIRVIASVTVGIDAEFTMAEAIAHCNATGFGYGQGMGPKAEVMIEELWRIDANGGVPTLLDRIISGIHDDRLWGFNNFRTTTESPPEPVAQFNL